MFFKRHHEAAVDTVYTRSAQDRTETELSGHILMVSAGLVGVCLTVIGLFQIVRQLRAIDRLADDLLALDALAFMLASLFAYLALRSIRRARRYTLERFADGAFVLGLFLMVAVCGLVTYQFI